MKDFVESWIELKEPMKKGFVSQHYQRANAQMFNKLYQGNKDVEDYVGSRRGSDYQSQMKQEPM